MTTKITTKKFQLVSKNDNYYTLDEKQNAPFFQQNKFYLPTKENLAAQSKSNRQGRGEVLEGDQANEVLELLKNDAERTYDNYETMLNERY
jgi:hypothetical protein